MFKTREKARTAGNFSDLATELGVCVAPLMLMDWNVAAVG